MKRDVYNAKAAISANTFPNVPESRNLEFVEAVDPTVAIIVKDGAEDPATFPISW